jgi:hypothetical protein
MSRRVLSASLVLITLFARDVQADTPPRVLFIRGGSGSGGLGGGVGADGQLSDIHDSSTAPGNHGFAELAALLAAEGFVVEQVVEGPGQEGLPVHLQAIDLSRYDVLVFGSNNASYLAGAVAWVVPYVCSGGSALFISDGNWGSDWGDAPSSDQSFLDAFDIVMNQDAGTYVVSRSAGDFVIGGIDRGSHPILAGPDGLVGTADDVNDFDGEGVSPATVTHFFPGIEPIVLAKAKQIIHLNDAAGSGSFQAPGVDDGALVALEYGAGRVACSFDRNTFFNLNGAGTSLHNWDNAQLARNLFSWLAGAPGPTYGTGCAGSGGIGPVLSMAGCAQPGKLVVMGLTQGLGGAAAFLLFGAGPATITLPSGCTLLTQPLLPTMVGPVPLSGSGPGGGLVVLSGTIPPGTPPVTIYIQGFVIDPGTPAGYSASNGVVLTVP